MPRRNPFEPEGVNPRDDYGQPLVNIPGATVTHSPAITPLHGDIVYRYAGDRPVDAGGAFGLDIDGSGTLEVAFEYLWLPAPGGAQALSLTVAGRGGSEVLATSDGLPAALPADREVGPDVSGGTFRAGAMVMASRSTVNGEPGPWGGPWVGVSRGYMGLQIVSPRGTLYGWLRLSVDRESGRLTIHGYAYRIAAEGALLTGQEA